MHFDHAYKIACAIILIFGYIVAVEHCKLIEQIGPVIQLLEYVVYRLLSILHYYRSYNGIAYIHRIASF